MGNDRRPEHSVARIRQAVNETATASDGLTMRVDCDKLWVSGGKQFLFEIDAR